MNDDAKPILVVGGGVAGMTAAVEAAEVGYRVVIVEREPYLGGRVMRSHLYFPKMCPPTCGVEINTRRIRTNPRIDVHTLATVEEVSGTAGDFSVRIRKRPRYVTRELSLDASVTGQLESERPDDLNLGMTTTKAVYLPHEMAYPDTYLVDREALSEADARKLEELLPAGVIDLDMQEEEVEIEVGAIILATGWRGYDASKIEPLGFGSCENVITNLMVERFAAANGPTNGEIVRPSDGERPENVAFVQCAGSRDQEHLPYCSSVCCMASLKQARYLRAQSESARATVFYEHIRTVGRLQSYFSDMLDDDGFAFIKGKVSRIEEVPESRDLVVQVGETLDGEPLRETFDMVVLATGLVPSTEGAEIPVGVTYDEYGFVDSSREVPGVFPVGCTLSPCDVATSTKSATAAALKAIQCLAGRETGA